VEQVTLSTLFGSSTSLKGAFFHFSTGFTTTSNIYTVIGSRAGGGHGPGGSPRGGVTTPEREDAVFWNRFSTNARLKALEQKLDTLNREWLTVQQEWDACATRVTKMLRRIRHEVEGQVVEKPDVPLADAPAGAIQPTGDRLARIRQQLAERGR
jgi:hypothetical protein